MCSEHKAEISVSWGIHREVAGDPKVVQKFKSHLINLTVLRKMAGPTHKSLNIFNFFIYKIRLRNSNFWRQ